MGVWLVREDTKDIVVLVDGLAKVAAFLLVPPVAVRVAEGALHCGRVLVSAVLFARWVNYCNHRGEEDQIQRTMPMSSTPSSPTKFSVFALFSEAYCRDCVRVVRGTVVRTAFESGRAILRDSIWRVVNGCD